MDENDQYDPLQRPTGACSTCPPPKGHTWSRADAGFATCSGCYDKIRERIAEVGERYLLLDPRPGAQGEMGSRGSPGFGSKPPLSLHVVSMRDPRSSQDARTWLGKDGRLHQEETRPPLSVHGTLNTLAWAVAEHRDVAGPSDRDDVWALLRFLDRHVDHVTRHAELAVEVAATLRELVAVLRPLTGDRKHRIGKCPRPAPNPDPEVEGVQLCGAVLYAPTGLWAKGGDGEGNDEPVISCHECGHVWGSNDFLELGDALDSAS